MTARIDWLNAKKDYIKDHTLTYADIAKKYGSTQGTVEHKARKEHWVSARKEVGQKAEEKAVASIIDKLAETDERHKAIYRNAEIMHVNMLSAYNAWIVDQIAEARKKKKVIAPRDLLSPFWLNQFMESLTKTVNQGRMMDGLPSTPINRVEGKFANVNVNLSPEQWEGVVDAASKAREVIAEYNATGSVRRTGTRSESSKSA